MIILGQGLGQLAVTVAIVSQQIPGNAVKDDLSGLKVKIEEQVTIMASNQLATNNDVRGKFDFARLRSHYPLKKTSSRQSCNQRRPG